MRVIPTVLEQLSLRAELKCIGCRAKSSTIICTRCLDDRDYKLITCTGCRRSFYVTKEFSGHYCARCLESPPIHKCQNCGKGYRSWKKYHNYCISCYHSFPIRKCVSCNESFKIFHPETIKCRTCFGL